MAWTIDDLNAIKAAIAKGEKSVSFADRTVVYRDIEDLIRAMKEIEAELAAAAERPRQYAAYSTKGFS